MSDIDATLSAAYDAAQGTPVVDTDTNTSISPDTRGPRPGTEPDWRDRLDEAKVDDDRLTEQVTRAWAKVHSDEAKAREANPDMPPIPEGTSLDETLRLQHEWSETPLEQRQAMARGYSEMRSMLDAAKRLGLKCESAADLKAVRDLANGNTQQQPEANVELSRKAETLDRFEQAYSQRGVDAIREVARQRGHELLDAQNPQHLLEAQLRLTGVPAGALLEKCGYVPHEHFAEAVGRAGAESILAEFAAVTPDFAELEPIITEIFLDPKFKRTNSKWKDLHRAADRARRERSRRGYRASDAMEKTAGEVYERVHGAAA